MNEKWLRCQPTVFKIPEGAPRNDGIALLMPFDARFNDVCVAVKETAAELSLRCDRADDIWNDSVIINDIFELIYNSSIVVCDCTGRNPNVFYEVGIAHILGREVIPITQSLEDIPFDLKHHRCLKYLPNNEGLTRLKKDLGKRIKTIIAKNAPHAMQLIWGAVLPKGTSRHFLK